MEVSVSKTFEKDIRKITDKRIAKRILDLIEILENSKSIHSIRNLKKLKTPGNYFRIRLGNYRLGLLVEKNTVYLLRIMDRKEIYDYFP